MKLYQRVLASAMLALNDAICGDKEAGRSYPGLGWR